MTSPTSGADLDGEIGLAWWNTSLSPNVKKGRATADELRHAARVVDELIEGGATVIGLCEISQADLEFLCINSALANFNCTEPERSVSGRSAFDTCIAYDPVRLTLLGEVDILVSYGGGHLRLGQRFEFKPTAGGARIHAIISHWPSRNTLGSNDSKRVIYGAALRDRINGLLDSNVTAQIVLMGDYNDEPFNDSICVSLRASRDRERSRAKPDVLYNPFWRHLASFQHDGHDACSDQGTYYYKSGDISRWHTFDQMIFSNALLTGKAEWRLDEQRTRAYTADWLDALIQDRQSIFDHRPIIGRLMRA